MVEWNSSIDDAKLSAVTFLLEFEEKNIFLQN